MTRDFRTFVDSVRAFNSGAYFEVNRELDPVLEVSSLQHKLALSGRFPLIYCPRVRGSKLAMATNVFGSYPLLGIALGMEREEILNGGQQAIVDHYRKLKDRRMEIAEYKGVKAPVHEVVIKGKDVDLGILPIAKHAVGDSNRYISSGVTITKDPITGVLNAGIYRLEMKSNTSLGCRINPGSNGTEIVRRYAEFGKKVEVVVIIGHHPLVVMAAGHLVPLGVNEFEIAGGLLGEAVQMTRATTVDLPVPAYAEIAIEGVMEPRAEAMDGPVAEAMGFYGEPKPCFIIQVTAITMRHDAIYHDLYPAHQEHFMVSILPRQIEVFDKVKSSVPSLIAVNYGPDHHPGKTLMYLSLRKESDDDGRRAGEAVLKADRWVSMAIVVDSDVNVYDDREVLWAMAVNVRGENCIFNYPAERYGFGLSAVPRTVIDATRPMGKSSLGRVVPPNDILKRLDLDGLSRD